MIDERINNITNELEKIKKDYFDVERQYFDMERQCISYECSKELSVGQYVLVYGALWKIVVDSNNLDECIKRLGDLYNKEEFDGWETEIKETIDKVVSACVNRENDNYFATYTMGVQTELEQKIKQSIWKNCGV